MGDNTENPNPLTVAMRESPLGRAQQELAGLRDNWAKHGITPFPSPVTPRDPDQRGLDWFPKPKWISGWGAFEIFRLQTEPYQWAPPIARICQTIADQFDRDAAGANYVMDSLPPTHELLQDFSPGSNHWFRALYSLLRLNGAEGIKGWETLVGDLYDWIGPFDSLRICALFARAAKPSCIGGSAKPTLPR